MKILIIRTWPSLLDVQENTYNIQELGLAKALNRRGHQTDILFWTDGEERVLTIPVEGTKPIHVLYRHGKAVLKNVWFSCVKELAPQYDILQTAEYNQVFSCYLAGKYPHKTVVYHGPYDAPFNRNYNRMIRVVDLFFPQRYRKYHTTFLAKSKLAKQFLVHHGLNETQVQTVGVGVDAELFQSYQSGMTETEQRMRAQKTGLKLLYIGRIEPRRDPGFLLQILHEVLKQGRQVKLYIIGDGSADAVQQTEQKIAQMGLTEHVCWQRKAPQSRLRGVYEQADFFLLPTEYEIFGMVLLEAMYFETVVLTTPNGGADMLIQNGKNGMVLDKTSAAHWAQTICKLARDPAQMQQMGRTAHETIARHYTWDALAERFEQAYRKTCTES